MLDVRRPSQRVRVLCYRVRCGPARVLGALGDSSQPVARAVQQSRRGAHAGGRSRVGASQRRVARAGAGPFRVFDVGELVFDGGERGFDFGGVVDRVVVRAGSDDEEEGDTVPSMSEEEAKRKIGEDSKEFFAIRDLDEAEEQATKLNEGPSSR
ncbi:hypothetical protein NEOLEDRAFT_1184465 [Neolentinus lepideus HHB14362 ss-1]|uniref:Uncharacterized protein n=1 Tax=Neolentinus lepideus HHB14362 ss-1 TaxID=1314782 RepID=A0A165MDU3_9AGAM|nr:hypothetical protein NEOLEDRAFT_1184465 [Neolentinus lepideus HHB14362 ss-1]